MLMEAMEITANLIRSLMFFGIINNWPAERVIEECVRLGISEEQVNEVLEVGANGS